MYFHDAIKKMTGRKIDSVSLSPDKVRITFCFMDGYTQSFEVEGDCCSHSWIEYLEVPSDIQGATLMKITESDFVPDLSTDEEKAYDCLKVYKTDFHTDRGYITLEYRNSSNGYYGGYLIGV